MEPRPALFGASGDFFFAVRDGKASAFHDVTSVLVKDAGHWVHHDQLDEFMRIVKGFLAA